MKDFRVYFLVILVWIDFFSVSAQDAPKTLSLEESIQIGLNNSTASLKGKNQIDITGAQVLAAYGQLFLPDLNVGSSYIYTAGSTLTSVTSPFLVDSRRSNVTYQVVSTLNIFNGYLDYSTFKAAKLNKEVAELSLERAKQFIILDITQSYLQIVLDKEIVGFAEQNFQTSTQRENQLTEQVNVGRRAQSDLYQQQAQTALDQQFLINSQNKLRVDKILLLQKLRINAADNYEFNDPIVDESPLGAEYSDENALIRKAQEQRPDLRYSRYNQEAALWYIKRYRSGTLPKVFLAAGAYGVGAYYNKLVVNGVEPSSALRPFGTQLADQVYGAFSLNATWTIFDKNFTRSNVSVARATAANAQIDFENVNLQIIAEIRQAYGNYTTALQQISTTEKGLVAAQKAFETINGRYQVGSANFIEVAINQNNLLQAKQNRAQTAINLYLQKKTIDYYLGGN
jgi:outer membrane protein